MTLAPGSTVRVDARAHIGHHRTPHYLKGRTGVIVARHAAYPNPEGLGYNEPGLPKKHLVRVRFRQVDLWPAYPGPAADTLDADIYEHWLQEV